MRIFRNTAVAGALLLLTVSASSQTRILWSFDTRDASFGQSAAGDIDGDGKLEVVFGCYRNDSCIYALNSEDGTLLWKYNAASPGFEGCNDVAPLIADADGDGAIDVIVASSCNPTTYCFDGKTGAVKWAARTRGSDSPPTMGDVDADGKLEILHGEFGGWVRCLNAEDGSLAWDLAVDTHSWIQTAPTLLDADGNGAPDFVVATWNRTSGDTNTVRAYRCSDRALLWRVPLTDVVYHGTAVADLDRDGKPELALGDYSGRFSVLNAEDGSSAWTTPPVGSGHYIGAPASIADVDGDGFCEVIFVSWYKIFVYAHNGIKQWEYDIPGYATAFRGAALADVDNDALPDLVFGTSAGSVMAVKGTTGTLLWAVDLAAHYGNSAFELDHAPVIADFDADGSLDLFIVGGHAEYPDFSRNFGRGYALNIGRGQGPDWLMFQNNISRDANLCRRNPNHVDIAADGRRSPPRLYPLPAQNFIDVEADDLQHIDVFDASGRRIAGTNVNCRKTTLDISTYSPGTYYLVLIGTTNVQFQSFIRISSPE